MLESQVLQSRDLRVVVSIASKPHERPTPQHLFLLFVEDAKRRAGNQTRSACALRLIVFNSMFGVGRTFGWKSVQRSPSVIWLAPSTVCQTARVRKEKRITKSCHATVQDAAAFVFFL